MIPNITTDTLPQPPEQPTILVNIGSDNPTRGDAAGWRGMARSMAKKIGARVIYADDKTVRDAFPGDARSYEELLAKYIEQYNPPEAVFGQSCHDTMRMLGQDPHEVYLMSDINEGVTRRVLGRDNELVTHHLTPEDMEEHGALFDEKHPNIKKPIISVMLMDPGYDRDRKEFAYRIVRLMSHYPEATIYLCGSRHTQEDNYDDLLSRIQKEINEKGHSKKLDVTGYKFEKYATYNPYKGLIARSKHVVVWGSSQSLVTEALYTGRTVYLHNSSGFTDTLKKGLVANFNELATNEAPLSREFEPVNLTDQVVDKLLVEKNDKDSEYDKKVLTRAEIKEAKEAEEWQRHLKAIRRNHRAATMVPKHLRQNPDFVKAALKIRGFSLQHFPEYSDDREMVALAVDENRHAVRFIGQALKGLKSYIEDLMNSVSCYDAFQIADPELQKDPAFIRLAVRKDRKVFGLLDPKIQRDPEVVTEFLHDDMISIEQIPKDVLVHRNVALQASIKNASIIADCPAFINDIEFAKEVMAKNPGAYGYFGIDVRKDKELAFKAMKHDIYNIHSLPDELKTIPAIAKLYLEKGGNPYPEYIDCLDDDMLRDVIAKNPAVLIHAPATLKKERKLAEQICKKDYEYLEYFDESIRNDNSLISALIDINPRAFVYAGAKAKGHFKTAKKAVLALASNIDYVSENLKENPSFIRAFVARHPESYRALPEKSRHLKGIEDLAYQKHPDNLRYTSDSFRDRADIVLDIINNRPELFGDCAPEARRNHDNIRKIMKTENRHAIYGIDPQALIDDKAFFKSLLSTESEASCEALVNSISGHLDFRNSRSMILFSASKCPDRLWQFLNYDAQKNPDFMKQIASLPQMKAEYLAEADLHHEDSLRAIFEVRPEFAENYTLFRRAYPSSSYPRLSNEEVKQAEKALLMKPITNAAKSISGGVKSISSAFAAAASGFGSSKKPAQQIETTDITTAQKGGTDLGAAIDQMQKVFDGSADKDANQDTAQNGIEPKKAIITDEISEILKTSLSNKNSFIPNKYIGLNEMSEALFKPIKTPKFSAADAKAFTEDLAKIDIKKYYNDKLFNEPDFIEPFHEHKLHHYENFEHKTPERSLLSAHDLAPEQLEIDGVTYERRDLVVFSEVGIKDNQDPNNHDLSDNATYPNNSIFRALAYFGGGKSHDYKGFVYSPVQVKPEHILSDGTICEYEGSFKAKSVVQKGQDVWLYTEGEKQPIRFHEAVIGPAKEGTANGLAGIYKRTSRKSETHLSQKAKKKNEKHI